MKKLSFFLLIFLILTYSCQKKNHFIKTDDGLEYCFIEKNDTGKQVNYGDIVRIIMQVYANDSLIFDTRKIDLDYKMKVDTPSVKNDINEAFAMMHTGDSAIFKIDAFNFYHYTTKVDMPRFIKKGDQLTFHIRVLNILSKEEIEQERQQLERRKKALEKQLLKEYLNKNNINVKPTQSGLYFISKKKGYGRKPQIGDSVFIAYKVLLINNMVIDTASPQKPYGFVYGDSLQIKGFTEGIGMMREGGKAQLIIPSDLAYGSREIEGIIPAYSTLVFNVELLKVKKN